MTLRWFGIALIVIGSALMLDRLEVISVPFALLLWLFVGIIGIAKVTSGFTYRVRGRVFLGSILTLFAVYGVVRNLDMVSFPSYFLPAVILGIVGLSLVAVFACSPRDWHVLIPGVFLIGMSSAIVMTEMGYFQRYEVVDLLKLAFPLVLIAFGVALLLRRRSAGF